MRVNFCGWIHLSQSFVYCEMHETLSNCIKIWNVTQFSFAMLQQRSFFINFWLNEKDVKFEEFLWAWSSIGHFMCYRSFLTISWHFLCLLWVQLVLMLGCLHSKFFPYKFWILFLHSKFFLVWKKSKLSSSVTNVLSV